MNSHRLRAKLVRHTAGVVIAACASFAVPASCQSSVAGTYSYTSAVIRTSSSGMPGSGFRVSDTALESINTTLSDLLQFAYALNASQILEAPSWAETDKFDLSLVFPGDLPNDAQCKAMVRKALAERFGLTAHRVDREMPVYRLRVSSAQVKLAGSLGNPNGLPGLHLAAPGQLEARNASIADLASTLQRSVLDRPVLDESGLKGRYDFSLMWTPAANELKGNRGAVPAVNSQPSLSDALSEQLGLTLEAAVASSGSLVIDHLEKPSLH